MLTASPGAFSSPAPARGVSTTPRTPEEQMRSDFANLELEGEVETLRRKAAAQEESLNKYRVEAEQLIAGNGRTSSESKANGMMKAWLRDAKKQSEELKSLFEQSRIVATESATIAKRDYEKKTARLRQTLAECGGERDAARADKQAAEEALNGLRTQVYNYACVLHTWKLHVCIFYEYMPHFSDAHAYSVDFSRCAHTDLSQYPK